MILSHTCKPRLSKRVLKKLRKLRCIRRRKDWRRKNWNKQILQDYTHP